MMLIGFMKGAKPMIDATAVFSRVQMGAAWFDEHIPDWYIRVDVTTLMMSHLCRCISGQIWGDFRLCPASFQMNGFQRAKELGLEVVGGPDEYDLLREYWIEAIKARRIAAHG
jgi:hypothetical protein